MAGSMGTKGLKHHLQSLAGILCGLLLCVGPGEGVAQRSRKGDAESKTAAAIIDIRRALGDGLPQVAAVKASQFLDDERFGARQKREVAGIAVEAWVRSRDGRRAKDVMSRFDVDHEPYWQGQAEILLGDFDAAEEALRRYPSDGELAGEARLALAYVMMAEGREASARKELKDLRTHSNAEIARHAQLLFNELELVVGRNQVVLDRLSREQGGKSGQVQFLRAKAWLQLGDAAKAEALLSDMLTMKNLGAHLHDAAMVLFAEVLIKQQRTDEAREWLILFLDGVSDTDYWHEAFDLLNRAHMSSRARTEVPAAVIGWIADGTNRDRQAYAMFWVANWLNELERRSEALGLVECFMQLHARHRMESRAMRLAMAIHGQLKSDSRVLDLAKRWRQQYGGGGESLVDFMTGGIFYARGDFQQALSVFQRSADLAANLAERRRALYNAAVAAARLGQMALYQGFLSQLQATAEVDAESESESKKVAGAGGDTAADLELNRALELAARRDPAAEGELVRFAEAHAGHPRWADAKVALAELCLLDLPPRVKDAAAALQAAAQRQDLGLAARERIDYVTMWLREAEGNLRGVVDGGLDFLRQWPASALVDQVRMKVGETYYRLEDFANARTQFELLASDHPSSPYADMALFYAGKSAMELMTTEGLERAIEIWGELAERGGSLALAARLQQVQAIRREGREVEALELIDAILGEKGIDAETALDLRCQRVELLIIEGRNDPKQREAATAAARALHQTPGLAYIWKARTGSLLAQALQEVGMNAEALAACYDVVNAGLEKLSGPANAAEYFWFYWAGFRAVTLLEAEQQWEGAAKMAERLAQAPGDRAAEAKERATRIRLEHFLWDNP